jgi:hypothetical protein
MNKLDRFINWLYALVGSYFWLPCPICRENFGGHETGRWGITNWTEGKCVCNKPACQAEAERMTKEFMKNNPPPVRYIELKTDG